MTFDAFKTTNKSGSRFTSVLECKTKRFWNNILDDKEVSKEFFLGYRDYYVNKFKPCSFTAETGAKPELTERMARKIWTEILVPTTSASEQIR